MGPEEDAQVCHVEGCGRPAIYQIVKLADKHPEQEEFFCQAHGVEYATRGHLVISDNG